MRWHGPAAEARTPATRLRAERHLAAVDWQPPGMPPAAVLVLRRVVGPHLEVGRPWPSSDWQAQMQRQIADLYHRAAQPARETVPLHAPGVLFADEAEMLACLTADTLAGSVHQRWYWRVLWRELPSRPADALTVAWTGRPSALPSALRLLPARDAARAVALLDRRQVSAVVRALHAAYVLPDRVLQMALPDPSLNATELSAVDRAAPAPPWRSWPVREAEELAPQARYLLGLATTLAEMPGYARSTAFAAAAVAWLASALAAEHPWKEPPPAPLAAVARGGPAKAAAGVSLPRPEAEASRPAGTGQQHPAATADLSHPALAPTAQPGRSEARAADAASVAEEPPEPLPSPAAADRLSPATWAGNWTATSLGGVLYLVNLLQRLDLPNGWPDPALAEHVGGWGLLEALARAFIGLAAERGLIADAGPLTDPLWVALAELDGRQPGDQIGAGLLPPRAFRLPGAWLRRFTGASLHWLVAAAGGRLVVWDADRGFVVVDAPLDGRAPAQALAEELAAYRADELDVAYAMAEEVPPLPALPLAATRAVSDGLAWLLQRLLGFVHWWLTRTVACPSDELSACLWRLLCVEGRVLVSRTHVDLFLPIDRIDIAARRAGLDRDPGWAPDLGRIVSFHFV